MGCARGDGRRVDSGRLARPRCGRRGDGPRGGATSDRIEYASGLAEADYSVVTPYLVPPGPKKVNVGDGFILDSATRLLGARPRFAFSSRVPFTAEVIERINSSRALVAVGAN